MTANPLFSSFKSLGTGSAMSRNTNYRDCVYEPPDKRQRRQMNSDSLWGSDDELGITDEQMIDFEIMASQAMVTSTPRSTVPGSNIMTSAKSTGNHYYGNRGATKVCPSSNGSKPVRQTNTMDTSLLGRNQSVASTSDNNGKNRWSLSSVGESKPGRDSGYLSQATKTFSKVQSNVSQRIDQAIKGSKPPDSHIPQDQAVADGNSSFSNILQKEVARLKEEVHKLRKENQGHDGEIKVLRDSLHQKEAELNGLKQEKVHIIDQHMREHTEKQREFERVRERITTQLQFKERELQESQSQFRGLEKKLQQARKESQNSVGYSDHSDSSNKTSPKSKYRKTKQLRSDDSPQGFPTPHSFGAIEKMQPICSTVTMSTKCTDTHDLVEGGGLRSRITSYVEETPPVDRLHISMPQGVVSASQLVSHLLSKDQSNSIVPLLSERPMKFDFQQLKQHKMATSPSKSKSSQFGTSAKTNNSKMKQTAQPIVSHQNHSAAMDAIQNLLGASGSGAVSKETDLLLGLVNPRLLFTFTGSAPEVTAREFAATWVAGDAICLLPLLHDYLRAYLECLYNSWIFDKTSLDMDAGSNVSLQESLNSSREYATTLKTRTFTSLEIIRSLVYYCKPVAVELASKTLRTSETKTILSKTTDAGPEVVVVDSDEDSQPRPSTSKLQLSRKLKRTSDFGKTVPTTMESINEATESLLSDSSHIVDTVVDILLFLVKERAMDKNAVAMACSCLDTLSAVAEALDREQLDRFVPVVKMADFTAMLDAEWDILLLQKTLKLMSALVPSNHFVTCLCTQNDDCVLLAVYSLCTHQFKLSTPGGSLELYTRILHFLSLITSYHKGGITLLIESDCHCSVELIKSVVIMLNSQLEVYREIQEVEDRDMTYEEWCSEGLNGVTPTRQSTVRGRCVEFLRQGLLFLHLLSLHDAMFADHHFEVEHQFVNFICGIRPIYKQFANVSEFEMNALYDLWDFEQDDPDFSKEEDEQDSSENSRGEVASMETQ